MLKASEREARDSALREEKEALAEVRAAEEREAAEIEEAVRLVEEAMQRVSCSPTHLLRVHLPSNGCCLVYRKGQCCERSLQPSVIKTHLHAMCCDAQERAEFDEALQAVERAEGSVLAGVHPGAQLAVSDDLSAAAEQQLAALMDLGFHAELAAPLCDGVTAVEDLVETLTSQQWAPGDTPEWSEQSQSGAARGSRWDNVAKRFGKFGLR